MKLINNTSQIALVFIFLVIIAGSIVRMTGSGMGCPDWPKCFGHYIPPTELDDVLWHKHQEFTKGQMIVHDKVLWSAKTDFTSGEEYNQQNWERYTKHDYTVFNAAHTWTEYINRLFGAASGIPVLLLFVFSLFHIRKTPLLFGLSTAVLLMLGYEAWLGKLVVDGNLVPNQITKHMFGSIAIVALLLVIISRSSTSRRIKVGTNFKAVSIVLLLLLTVQILLGTQVREQIDAIGKATTDRSQWIGLLDGKVLWHRSFSLAFLFGAIWLFWRNWKYEYNLTSVSLFGYLVLAEVIFGVILYYFDVPRFAQPFHLILGICMFALLMWQVLRTQFKRPKKEEEPQ